MKLFASIGAVLAAAAMMAVLAMPPPATAAVEHLVFDVGKQTIDTTKMHSTETITFVDDTAALAGSRIYIGRRSAGQSVTLKHTTPLKEGADVCIVSRKEVRGSAAGSSVLIN